MKLLSHYISSELSVMTRAEKRVARVVLSDYPSAGLLSVAKLAKLSSVSGPTVLRFTQRLGFSAYLDFQQRLLAELSQRKSNTYDLRKDGIGGVRDEGLIQGLVRSYQDKLLYSLNRLPIPEFERAVELLSSPKSRITCTGGSYTDFLAQYLELRLYELRRGVKFSRTVRAIGSKYALDFNRQDVVVAVDIRRYQDDMVDFVRQADAKGAEIILITDPGLSPIAAIADCVLPVEVEGPPLFDSVINAVALMELLLSCVAEALGEKAQNRRKKLQAL